MNTVIFPTATRPAGTSHSGSMPTSTILPSPSRSAGWRSGNVGFQFLRLYQFLFRRISHGASRLQEVMADIEAVTHYGAVQFEEGLRHAILRGVKFDAAASRIDGDESLKTYAGLRALYEPTLRTRDEKSVEAEMVKAIRHPTSEDDTHPSPSDRFALARRIQFASSWKKTDGYGTSSLTGKR